MTLPTFRLVAPSGGGAGRGEGTVVLLGARPDAAGGPARPFPLRATSWLGLDLAGELARAGAPGRTGSAGEITVLQAADPAVRAIIVAGVGDGSPASLLRAGAAAARAVAGRRDVSTVLSYLPGPAARPLELERFVEGYALAAYRLPQYGSSAVARSGGGPAAVEIVSRTAGTAGTAATAETAETLRRAVVTARAVHLARDLANTPANMKSPQWLAGTAVRSAAAAGLAVRVRDEIELAAEGFGGLLAVGQGSARPPRFVELGYTPPGGRRRPHVVLVGKGIVFDSGGISLKPAAGMESMKTDMAGAAAVLAVMAALPDLGIGCRVTGLLAIAENMPGDAALRPSDVIVPYGGRHSVEVTNTDAEGRLVLADGLAYADLVLHADAVVDIATLTGAATMALGRLDAPLYATDEPLAAALLRASAESGERLWRMPLVEDYRPALASGTADLVNAVMGGPLGGGSILAALFLREFTGGRAWAHLDIAGTGRSEAAADELSKGATGFGVRLLLRFLERWA